MSSMAVEIVGAIAYIPFLIFQSHTLAYGSMLPKLRYHFALLSAMIPLLSFGVSAQSVHLKIPLTVTDVGGHSATVYFGVDPSATYCIDPSLGEFELPPERCGSAGLCVYFTDSRNASGSCLGNGLLLDYRLFNNSVSSDTYRVAFTSPNYPVTIYWPSTLSLYYDSASITDMSGGTAANMLTAHSLVISDPLIDQLVIQTWDPRGFVDGVHENSASAPKEFHLYQNYPNPFNPSTSIAYDLPATANVSLRVFDVLGAVVATLIDGDQQSGHHIVHWNASGLASGIYYCQFRSSGRTEIRTLSLIR